ncbi:hypothetical protein D3C78_977340 [compost metagenome]
MPSAPEQKHPSSYTIGPARRILSHHSYCTGKLVQVTARKPQHHYAYCNKQAQDYDEPSGNDHQARRIAPNGEWHRRYVFYHRIDFLDNNEPYYLADCRQSRFLIPAAQTSCSGSNSQEMRIEQADAALSHLSHGPFSRIYMPMCNAPLDKWVHSMSYEFALTPVQLPRTIHYLHNRKLDLNSYAHRFA